MLSSLKSHLLRSVAMLAVAALVGCTDLLVNSPPGSRAALAVAFQIAGVDGQPASTGNGEAFDKADAVRLVLTRPGAASLDTTLALPATAPTRRVGPISVVVRGSQEQVALSVELLQNGAILFRGEIAEVTLRAGRTVAVETPLVGVPGGVSVPASVPPMTSLGDTLQLSGTVDFATGDPIAGLALAWSTLDPDIVEVSADGRVVARAEGTARVVGTFGTFSSSLSVDVAPVVVAVAVEPPTAEISIDGAVQLVARMLDARGNVLPNRVAEGWISSSPIVADVDASGLVRGVAEGTATITSSFQNRSGTAQITVRPKPVASVQITPAEATLEVNQQRQLDVTLRAADGSVLTGREVAWESSAPTIATVDASGQVQARLPGEAVITARSEGRSGTARVTVVQTIRTGAVTGRVVNAVTGDAIAGATVGFGGNHATTTGVDGGFSISLPAGTYSAAVAAAGYISTTVSDITVVADATTDIGRVALSPVLGSDEFRVVLTWGATPWDLDSHLTGPLQAGGRFRVWYADRGSLQEPPYAHLDQDVTSGFGPETITIGRTFDGTYRYFVHDYTNQGSPSSAAMGASGAVVRVYRGAVQVDEFPVPNQPGTLWRVFDLEGSNGAITPVQTMSFDPPASVQSVPARGWEADAIQIIRDANMAPKH